MKIPSISRVMFLFFALMWAGAANAQVTYQPNIAASDFSGLGPLGGTAYIQYDLIGSPADSPFGSSFQMALTFGSVTIVGPEPTTPLSFANWQVNFFNTTYLSSQIDASAIQGSDLQNLGNPPSGENDLNELLSDGTLHPQYSYTLSTVVPEAAGWALTGEPMKALVSFVSVGGPGVWGFGSGVVRGDEFLLYPPTPVQINGITTMDLYYAAEDRGPDSFTMAADALRVNPLSNDVSLRNLTFNPVPEPASALLVACAGLLFLTRRHRAPRLPAANRG